MTSIHDRMVQLAIWDQWIRELSEKAQGSGARVRFADLLFIDELKALYAIAQTKFDELGAATGPEREAIEVEAQSAWVDLAAAFDRRENRHQED